MPPQTPVASSRSWVTHHVCLVWLQVEVPLAPSPGFDRLLGQHAGHRESCQVYQSLQDVTKGEHDEEMHGASSGGSLTPELLSLWRRDVTSQHVDVFGNQEAL